MVLMFMWFFWFIVLLLLLCTSQSQTIWVGWPYNPLNTHIWWKVYGKLASFKLRMVVLKVFCKTDQHLGFFTSYSSIFLVLLLRTFCCFLSCVAQKVANFPLASYNVSSLSFFLTIYLFNNLCSPWCLYHLQNLSCSGYSLWHIDINFLFLLIYLALEFIWAPDYSQSKKISLSPTKAKFL